MSTKVKWSPSDFPGKISKYPEALKETKLSALEESKDEVAKQAVQNIISSGKVYTKGTIDSILGGPESLTKVVSEHRAKVGSTAISAIVLEHGRRPGKMPPVSAIMPWAATKAGDGSEKAAYLIARKIGRTGTKGSYVILRALSQSKRAMEQIVIKVSEEALERLGFK